MGQTFEATLYAGDVELKRGANHVYRVRIEGGKSYVCPNATTIIGMLDKSRALIPWALKTAAQAFDLSVPTGAKVSMTPRQKQRIMDAIIKAPDIIRDNAADVGVQIDEYVTEFFLHQLGQLRGKPTKPQDIEARRAVDAFHAWVKKFNVKAVAVQKPVFSREHFYAGQADIIAMVGNRLMALDSKTGKTIYSSVFMQLSAYTEAWNEEHPDQIIDGRGVLLFERQDYELTGNMEYYVLPETHERDFGAFLACRTLYRFDKDAYQDVRQLRNF